MISDCAEHSGTLLPGTESNPVLPETGVLATGMNKRRFDY
jgi:hypothetical protein